MPEPIILARDVTRRLGDYPVLRGLTMSVLPGEFVALMGESGSGKTTFLNLVAGLDQADGGTLLVAGEEPAKYNPNELAAFRRRNVSIVFQDFSLLPTLNVLDNVLMPIRLRGERADSEVAKKILDRVGLSARTKMFPETLSGGEMQRAAIARALCLNPRILLADEPTGSLDSKNSQEVLRLLSELNAPWLTVVMVTHSPSAAAVAHRTVRMADGRLVDE